MFSSLLLPGKFDVAKMLTQTAEVIDAYGLNHKLTLLYPPGDESIMSMLEAALRIWPLQIA